MVSTVIYIGTRNHKVKAHPGDMFEEIFFHRSYARCSGITPQGSRDS
jgi:hypothetical protein